MHIFIKGNLISIHVLHVEDDPMFSRLRTSFAPFQSTSSMWRTTGQTLNELLEEVFQSTSSMWRTTDVPAGDETVTDISIHVLHVEDDRRGLLPVA